MNTIEKQQKNKKTRESRVSVSYMPFSICFLIINTRRRNLESLDGTRARRHRLMAASTACQVDSPEAKMAADRLNAL